jgi:hypothetical protein
MAKSKTSSSQAKTTAHRTIELPKRRWYNPRTWRRNLPLPPRKKISNVRQLVKTTFSMLKSEWRTFAGISIVYGFGVLIFVRSFSISSSAVESVASKQGFMGKLGGTVSQIANLLNDANIDRVAQYEIYGAIGIGILALASFVYGFRKKIFKTPYQRELDKIYRYHDGIIVRASRPTDLSGKRIVAVKSFDDMLNLEEELKLPIVAASVSAEATQFMIIRDDVVYAYILGKLPAPHHGRSLEEIAATVRTDSPKPKPPRKIQ